MIIIPAIDLMRGNVVRLYRGKKDNCKVYSSDPKGVAIKFKSKGAKIIHVVDLDAAFGQGENLTAIEDIVKAGVKIQVGGGIRSLEKADRLIKLGVERIIIGTKAVDPVFLAKLLERYPDKVGVGVDVLEQKFMKSGWQEATEHNFLVFIEQLIQKGVKMIIYTDISRDGTLEGADLGEIKKFKDYKEAKFIVSGGISSKEEIVKIKKELPFIYGLILGKALYEGVLDLKEAISSVE